MPDRIDEIYKTLIDYIREDNNDKTAIRRDLNVIKAQADRIEEQTTKTNGRVTKLEGEFLLIQDEDKKQIIIGAFKKKQIAALFAIIGGIWSVVSVAVYSWLQNKFFK